MEWYWILTIVLGSTLAFFVVSIIFYRPVFKRVYDIICALLVFIFLWPLWIVLAILVRTKLGSPIYFKQVRPGKDGKLFTLYKFRTMTNERDEDGNLLPDEKRLTSFGKWLRKTSLDEMPEAINIFLGQMSVVGPRPLLVKDYVFFDERIMKRQLVKPGLTGLAQIKGRNRISWEDKFEYDLEYCKNISFFRDITIIFQTIGKAFFKGDDINRDGFATDEDYGDYLLENKQVSQSLHEENIKRSDAIIKSYGKKN